MPLGLPRSRCGNCNKIVAWYENIPILSYVLLRGKCSGCKIGISIQYPLIELITGLFSLFLYYQWLHDHSFFLYIFRFTVFCIFLCIFVIDLKHKIIPDGLNLYLALIFSMYSFLFLNWKYSLIGAGIGFGMMLGVTWLFYQWKGKIGLGGGDIKLFGALGIYLGPLGIIYNITVSCGLGAVIGLLLMGTKIIKPNQHIPFGPFIIVTAIIQIFFPQYFKLILN